MSILLYREKRKFIFFSVAVVFMVTLVNVYISFYSNINELIKFKDYTQYVTVTLEYPVCNPGIYRVTKGSTLGRVVYLAGGLRDYFIVKKDFKKIKINKEILINKYYFIKDFYKGQNRQNNGRQGRKPRYF